MGHAAFLINSPSTDEQWSVWSLHHRLSHDAIRDALRRKNIFTAEYVLEPIPMRDFQNWLQRNSQTHIEQTGALGLQSHDISDVDLEDENQKQSWIMVHWQEHQDMELALGL